MAITVLKNNAPWGPFTRAQIEDGLARGDFTVKYLAHAPGLKEWLPLGEVLDYVERNAEPHKPSLPPVPGSRDLPPVPKAAAPAPPPSRPQPASRPPNLPEIRHLSEKPAPPPPAIPSAMEKREIKPEPSRRRRPLPFSRAASPS